MRSLKSINYTTVYENYYEGQDSVIPLSDIYIEEISLPPCSNFHIFKENTRLESPGNSKLPPINNFRQSLLASTPPQGIHCASKGGIWISNP